MTWFMIANALLCGIGIGVIAYLMVMCTAYIKEIKKCVLSLTIKLADYGKIQFDLTQLDELS